MLDKLDTQTDKKTKPFEGVDYSKFNLSLLLTSCNLVLIYKCL